MCLYVDPAPSPELLGFGARLENWTASTSASMIIVGDHHDGDTVDDTDILELGRLAVGLGYCAFAEVKQAAMQHAANPGSTFTDILLERRAVTPEQLDTLLLLQSEDAEDGRDVAAAGPKA